MHPKKIFLYISNYLKHHNLKHYGTYTTNKFNMEKLTQIITKKHHTNKIISYTIDPNMIQTDILQTTINTNDISDHHSTIKTTNTFLTLLKNITIKQNNQPINL